MWPTCKIFFACAPSYLPLVQNWDCIDTRQEVVKYWRENNTWLRKPIFINASLIKKDNKFHLVEGHTRVGILKGAVQNGILDIESTHEIWYGNYK